MPQGVQNWSTVFENIKINRVRKARNVRYWHKPTVSCATPRRTPRGQKPSIPTLQARADPSHGDDFDQRTARDKTAPDHHPLPSGKQPTANRAFWPTIPSSRPSHPLRRPACWSDPLHGSDQPPPGLAGAAGRAAGPGPPGGQVSHLRGRPQRRQLCLAIRPAPLPVLRRRRRERGAEVLPLLPARQLRDGRAR